MNVDSIAFLTSRTPAAKEGESARSQLLIGFSAATAVGGAGSMMPLSLVMEGEEASEFLDQLGSRGVVVDHLRSKLA